MIDLLAMLALPSVPVQGEVPEAVPMTDGDITDFSAVLAQVVAQVLPSPLAPLPTPGTPHPSTSTSTSATPQIATCDVPSNISSPSITSSNVVAVLPVPVAFQRPVAVAQVAASLQPDAQGVPELTDWASGHPVAPATPQALPVTDTDVPEREGAPATAVLPEPASKALEQPAALGVLGSDWGDGNVQRRDTPPSHAAHPAPPSPAQPVEPPTATPSVTAATPLATASAPTASAPIATELAATTQLTPHPRLPASERATVSIHPQKVAEEPVFDVPIVDLGVEVKTPVVPTNKAEPVVVESTEALPVRNEAPDLVVMPTIGEADMPVDAPEQSASPMATATAAQASTRAERPDADALERPTRDRHVNGIAAPLRRAIEHAKEQRDGDYTMTVRLDPPELGTVRIRVVSHGDKVQVTVHTELAEAKTELQNKQRDIADILRSEGFSLDGFDVDTSDRRFEQQQERRNETRRSTPTQAFALPDDLADDGELRL